MTAVLKYTLVVRDQEDNPVALLAGRPVPDWAAGLVHSDDLEGEDTARKTPAKKATSRKSN